MKFYPLKEAEKNQEVLAAEYREAREIGVVKLGDTHLYFKKGRKIYYIPYLCIRRAFRRVMLVPAKLCCGKGELQVENLVICSETEELAQIGLPGTRAAKGMMEELKKRIPDADFTAKPAEKAK
ncbi:MAG: hypothetical protein HFI66_06765 [Lachnospiraceae bacterium]|nr:hypothetical protein [Lachnospiraceae bacterium]